MIRVIVADDHAIVRSGISRLIEDERGMSVVGQVDEVDRILSTVRSAPCDVLLLDVNMKETLTLEALKAVRDQFERVAVLVLSVYPEKQYAMRYLRAGAAGYVSKENAPEELIAAVRRVASGKRYLSEALAEAVVFGDVTAADRAPHEVLSDREYEVMVGLAHGKRIRQIADEIFLSEKTVSTYRTRILKKLNLDNNAAIVEYALSNHIV